MSVPLSIDPNDLAQAGWGVVFHGDMDAEARRALSPLLDLRRAQCGKLYRELIVKRGDTASRFLGRYGISPGAEDPERMPYYLLIVGSPEHVPFQFQQQLDLGYAVGRLHFDSGDEYSRYAMSVVDAEQSRVAQERRLAVVAPRFAGDRHTDVMATELIEPLLRDAFDDTTWNTRVCTGALATKSAVMGLFREFPQPAMLVAATHALVARDDNPSRRGLQGALVCQDWPGITPAPWLTDGHYLSGNDLRDALHVQGMMALLWGSFTAGSMESGGTGTGPGTGSGSGSSSTGGGSGSNQAPTSGPPFVSALAQRLLAGGALGVIGSLDRLLGFSFPRQTTAMAAQTQALKRTMRALMAGQRIGHAAQALDDAYATSATQLSEMLERVRFGSEVSSIALAELWATTTDLRNIALIGDPAVRLPAAVRGSNA